MKHEEEIIIRMIKIEEEKRAKELANPHNKEQIFQEEEEEAK